MNPEFYGFCTQNFIDVSEKCSLLCNYDQVCKDAGQEWIEDPTNSNRTFARNRIRQVLADPLYGELGALLRSEV